MFAIKCIPRFASVLRTRRMCLRLPTAFAFSDDRALKPENSANLKVTFVKSNNKRITVNAKEGDSLLDVVVNNDIDIDGFGACEGTLCCSSCHLIFKEEDYNKLKPKPSDEEQDLLDLAFGLTETSRLGCQINLSRELDGIEVIVPDGIHDARTS